MGEPRLAEVREIFAAALELPAERRKSFLDKRCAGAPELRLEVELMLARHGSLGSFLEKPLFGRAVLELAEGARLAPTLFPGERVGDFEIESFLAAGGSGEVYRARELSPSGRQVALKVQQLVRASERGRERFIREAETASTIREPHLVQVYDYGEEPERGLLYYAMRLVEGPTLEQVLAELALAAVPPSEAIRRALVERSLEIAGALAALHARDLVHRDVKPANIVLEGAGACPWERPAVLVDFGLVRQIEAETTHSTRWATPPYSAPEVLLGGAIDARADVRSLGLIMHDLLAARMPEQRTKPHDEAPELLGELVPGVDRDLEAIVAAAAAPERQWRYPDCRMLAEDLRAWLDRKPVSARKTRGLARLLRWVERHPGKVLAWSGRGILLGLAALFLILGVQSGVRVLAAARDAEDAWAAGDLESLQGSLPAIPKTLRSLLLPAEFELLRAVDAAPGGPLRSVYRMLASDGEAAARLHAARFLERDGLRAHPKLAQFLLRSLDEAVMSRSPEGPPELRLVARLFFERPAESPAELSASAPFRARLLEILEHARDPLTGMYALTALSGCGRPSDLPRVLAWTEAKLRPGSPHAVEAWRLALCCMQEITRRTRVSGLAAELFALDLRGLVSRASAALTMLARRSPGAQHAPARAMLDLYRQLIFSAPEARRGSGFVDPELQVRPWPRLLAARGDARLERELREGRGLFLESDMPPGHQLFSRPADYHHYGHLAGSYGKPALEQELGKRVRAEALAHHFEPAHCAELFRQGLAQAHGERSGDCPELRPDPDTRLGAALEAAEIRVEHPELRRRQPSTIWSVAVVDFVSPEMEGSGLDISLELRGVPIEHDEWQPDSRFARLGLPGSSEIRLSFAVAPEKEDGLMIQVYWQKGQRSRLPYGGRAGIEILLDGRRVAGVWMRGNSARRVALPLARVLGPRKHVVTIRPSPGSNTTVRLYSVRICYK